MATETKGLPINGSAWRLAFCAGQEVERLLLERADELAKTDNLTAVTVDQVRAAAEQCLIERLRSYLHEYEDRLVRRAG